MTEEINQNAALGMIRSGRYLPDDARRMARRLLVVAIDHDATQLAELAEHLLVHQLAHPYIKPVVLATAMDASALSAAGFLYETAMTRVMWHKAGFTGTYEDYVAARIGEMTATFQVPRVVTLQPGEHLPAWALDR